MMILLGEDPPILGRCNYDTVSPKHYRDVAVMGRGVSDEAIVAVKLLADDGAVTYLRIKAGDSNRMLEAKGGTC